MKEKLKYPQVLARQSLTRLDYPVRRVSNINCSATDVITYLLVLYQVIRPSAQRHHRRRTGRL